MASGAKKNPPGNRGKKVVDKKKVRCFNCNKLGHYASECDSPASDKSAPGRSTDRSSDRSGGGTACGFVTADVQTLSDISDVWYGDSGATDHMTHDSSLFCSYEKFQQPRLVRVGNKSVITAYGQGRINISSVDWW